MSRIESAETSPPPAGPTVFIPYQHPLQVDTPPDGRDWIHEIKFDGYRIQAQVLGGRAVIFTRNGHDWTARFPDLVADLAALPDCILDGELCAVDPNGQPDFAALQAAVRSPKRAGNLVYFAFDTLSLAGEDLRAQPLTVRKAALAEILAQSSSPRIRWVDHFEQGGRALLQSACELQLEGIVSKRRDAPYASGLRNDTWRKAKCRPTVDVAIIGWVADGSTLRALLAATKDGQHLRYAGRILTGFNPTNAAGLMKRLKALERATPPAALVGAPSTRTGVIWTEPQVQAELQVAEITPSGKLRQASFRRWRNMEDAGDVGKLPVPAPTLKKSVRPRAKPAEPNQDAEYLCVPPHPEAEAIKSYLASVAHLLLPYVYGRPCSVLLRPASPPRADDFERHADQRKSSLALDPRAGRVSVATTGKTYFRFDSLSALHAAIDAGGVEFHPWQCLPDRPDLAGRFIVDLDPGEGVSFEQVIEGAHEVRRRLERSGLRSFVKTTGGKGLHVVAPFQQDEADPISWTRSKAFIRRLCEDLADAKPEQFTAKLSKSERGGRLFLDYLRNGQTNTAAALLTPRNSPELPVSMPVSWESLEAGLDPRRYTVATLPLWIAEAGSWGDYEADPPSLRRVLALR